MRREQQHHRVVGDLVDEHIGNIGHHDVVVGRRIHVHRVRADTAKTDDHALVQTPDDVAIEIAPAGDQSVGLILDRLDKLVVALGRHFDDLGADGIEGLSLK